MTTAPSSISYQELKPLPIPKHDCPRLKLLVARIGMLFATSGVGAGAGAVAGLSTLPISVLTGAVLGGTIGVICGIALCIFVTIPSVYALYRINTLNQIKNTITEDSILKRIEKLQASLGKPFVRFEKAFHNHMLHYEISLVTDAIDKTRPDIKAVWEAFLTHLHQKRILNADGKPIRLDFSFEMKRLREKITLPHMELLSKESPTYSQDLKAVENIERVSFGQSCGLSKEQIEKIHRKSSQNLIIVARAGEKVIGVARTEQKGEKIGLASIARLPGAALLKIGHKLMEQVISQYKSSEIPLCLHVRASNRTAIALYQKWGFETKKVVPNYYTAGSGEAALYMELNWEKASQRLLSARRH